LFNAGISERNLSGAGKSQRNLCHRIRATGFIVSYNEPYFNDTKVALGITAFNTETDYPDFDERKLGMAVSTSYPLGALPCRFGGPQERSVKRSDELNRDAP
jgi:outer membrane protein assembly factor BamA